MNRRTAILSFAAPALGLAGPARAQSRPTPPGLPGLAAYEAGVREHLRTSKTPGATVGFVKNGQTWLKAFGVADLENGTPTRADSAYRLASVQKTMSAAAVLQLVERGRLDLDREIQAYVPYFPRKPHSITARQLLHHLSGIPHYLNREVEQHIKVHKTTREAVAIFQDFDLLSTPGERFSYSSYGYNLLGAAIEGASGQPYGEYMRRNIWSPLGMDSTRLDDPVALIPNRVRGYRHIDGELRNSEFIDISSRFAAGGTRGTVLDLLRFQQGLFEGKLLAKRSLDLMVKPSPVKAADGIDRGMGCNLLTMPDGRLVVANDGGQQETRTFFATMPGEQIHIALAQNLEIDNYGPLLFPLFEAVFGAPLPVPKR